MVFLQKIVYFGFRRILSLYTIKYKEFYSWVEREIDNVKTRYCYDIYNEPDNGFVCEVLHIAKHNEHLIAGINNDTLAYIKHLDTGRCYLISVKGLEKC